MMDLEVKDFAIVRVVGSITGSTSGSDVDSTLYIVEDPFRKVNLCLGVGFET